MSDPRPLNREDLERMNIPDELWRVSAKEVAPAVRTTIDRYLEQIRLMVQRGAGLILGGGPGVGKSAIGALVAKQARSVGFTVYFGTVWELRECHRARIMFDDALTVLDRAREVDVLVLDGLKQEDKDERFFGLVQIEELLSTRAAKRKVSIITTRMTNQDLESKMAALAETVQGSMVYLQVNGPNKRDDQHKELKKMILGTK